MHLKSSYRILMSIPTASAPSGTLLSMFDSKVLSAFYVFILRRNDRVPAERPQGTCIHWQVSQATSLANIRFEMSAAPGTAHQGMCVRTVSQSSTHFGLLPGVWMENGRFDVLQISLS